MRWIILLFLCLLPVRAEAFLLPYRANQERKLERLQELLTEARIQSARIEGMLQAQQQYQQRQEAQPRPESQRPIIIEIPNWAPRQQLPIEGQPKQQLPIEGHPKQPLPIEGPPKQPVPIEGPPRQELPGEGKPRQELPGQSKPRQELNPGGPVDYTRKFTPSLWRPQ